MNIFEEKTDSELLSYFSDYQKLCSLDKYSFSLILYLLLILWVKTELRQSLPPITSGFQLLRSLSANKYFC